MSQQNMEEQKNKPTPTEIKHYLKEQYRKGKVRGIEINPPRSSRNFPLYRTWKKRV